jgi:RNA polymerase sigma-70 factor (ECF subfamily)
MSTTRFLVTQAQRGNAGALEQLLRIWYPRLRRAAVSLLRNEDGAEDVVQETCLKVSQNISKLVNPAAFAKWIHQILRRCCVDFVRRDRWQRFRRLDFDDASLAIDDSGLCTWSAEQPVDLDGYLHHLGAEGRQVLRLRVLLGLSVRETSDVLGIPEGTVKSRLHTARERLRRLTAH